ncbi:MAG: sulfatase-like hydrolase/transferase, partial [Bdellovibrionaceae bacterium]|nr:sulfatase-like hydrolase/transferase [Pseudobdellovibrionaceae bacterium]
LGYGSINSYGAPPALVRTPQIDRLARDGMRFTQANTPASVCTPTRYALLTGRYTWRGSLTHGVVGTSDPMLVETSRTTLPKLFKNQGYQTAQIGKWHLGYGDKKPTDYHAKLTPGPNDLGFDYHSDCRKISMTICGYGLKTTGCTGCAPRNRARMPRVSTGRRTWGSTRRSATGSWRASF